MGYLSVRFDDQDEDFLLTYLEALKNGKLRDIHCNLISPGEKDFDKMIADIYISISMETFEHRKYKIRGDGGHQLVRYIL